MIYPVNILDAAKYDYREIRKWVRIKFGENTWFETETHFKKMLNQIGAMPHAGEIPDEITELGLTHYRQRLMGQTRIIYQITEQAVYIHLFVDSSRDFSTMLNQRLMQAR
jgi:plasmid stabilization system protein ParE